MNQTGNSNSKTRAKPRFKYRAAINIDVTNQKGKQYQKLIAGLIQQKWKYIETSALIRSGSLAEVLRALELLAKQCPHIGQVSAITYHIQGSKSFAGKTYAAARFHPNAQVEIKMKSMP